ncbi:MAG: succinoglycan biosynthesis protein ExoM [Cyclobacteriaceae bacterium]|jgi:succinoglycan biosynthesis protein ExoM
MKKESIIIGLGTCLRPQMLANCLLSLCDLELPEAYQVKLMVIDNDESGSAQAVFNTLVSKLPMKAEYLIEKSRGIVHMRNRVLEKAVSEEASFIAFIDDDETVEPSWLIVMLKTLLHYDADVVDGAVERILPEGTPDWIVRGGFLKWSSRPTGTLRQSGSTSTVLFKAKLITTWGLRFNAELNLSGSSDTYLFSQAYQLGAKIVWLNETLVKEYFPPSRATQAWILQRAFRRTNSKFIRLSLRIGYWPAAFQHVFIGLFQLFAGALLFVIVWPLSKILQVQALRVFYKGLGTFNGILGKTYEEYKEIHGS